MVATRWPTPNRGIYNFGCIFHYSYLLMLRMTPRSINSNSVIEVYLYTCIQVPCKRLEMSAAENLEEFCSDFPVVAFIGTPKLIDLQRPYEVDKGVQLVCKYLKRFDTSQIDVLCRGIVDSSLNVTI